MFKNITTKSKLLIFLSISLMIFIIVLISYIYLNGKQELEREKELFSKNTTVAYSSVLKNYETFYRSKLESILAIKGVMEAIESKDRLTLHKLVNNRWEKLKKDNKDITIMHFHKSDGLTLLRMHNPKKYDDNIAKKRAMCRYIHKDKKFISSFEAGIHLLGYRVMLPIFNDNKYLGAIEIGVKPNFVLNSMKESHKVAGVIFAKSADIFNKKFIDKSNLKISDYRVESNTLEDKNLINYLPKDYKLNSDTIINKDNRTYAVYLFNHIDFKGETSAKTLIFNDITNIEDNFIISIIEIIIYSLLLYIILLVAIKIGFEKMLSKIDKTTNELQKSVAFLKSHQLAMDESSIVSKADLKGNITYVNDNFCKVAGYTKDEVIGKPHNLLRHPSNTKETFKVLWETIKAKKVWKGVLQNRGKDNDYWVDIVILPILDDKNNIVEYIAIRHDITKMIEQQQVLDTAANTDTLTGYGNRYKLNNDIKNSINPALAILNIDQFSQINDFYGHEKGDIVIKKLGEMISTINKNKNCKLYHLQGDEFVIFNKDISKNTFVENITKLSSIISTIPIILDEEEISLNLSTAISFENRSKILTSADMALKVAKKENKNIVVYSDFISLNDEYQNNIKWAKKIKDALENDKIVPVFQPIVNNKNGKWEKYEALVRLEDNGKLISPYFFLDISKKTKHYTQITKVMINKSFDMFKDKQCEFSVNLTIEDIFNEDIKKHIFDMLEKYKIGSRVVFEIVESESIENFEQIDKFITKIKSYGCKVAIDDFGTGYSNFEYLMKVKADYIKIDGSMIKDIDTNTDAQMVVSTIIEFSKKMGMKTIAEFVENESVLNKVVELGIDYTQGYYYSEPKRELNLDR